MQKNTLVHLLFLLLTLSIGKAAAPIPISYAQEKLMCENNMSIAPIVKEEIKEIIVATPQNQQIQIQVTPPPVVMSDFEALFEKYASEYNVNSSTLKIIAKCESGYNAAALSRNKLYGGLFQFSQSTWQSNRRTMGLSEDPNLRFNPEEAIKTAAFKISRDGTGAWPSCSKKIQITQK